MSTPEQKDAQSRDHAGITFGSPGSPRHSSVLQHPPNRPFFTPSTPVGADPPVDTPGRRHRSATKGGPVRGRRRNQYRHANLRGLARRPNLPNRSHGPTAECRSSRPGRATLMPLFGGPDYGAAQTHINELTQEREDFIQANVSLPNDKAT